MLVHLGQMDKPKIAALEQFTQLRTFESLKEIEEQVAALSNHQYKLAN